jgi:hypothetical protein
VKVMVLVVMAFSCLAAQAQDWKFPAAASGYIVPNGTNYVWTVIAADRRRLHLEGHYNYEDLRTGSAWIGYNFSAGGNVSLKYTPMVGVVFGRTLGVAPGQQIRLDWRKLEFYSENELVFNIRQHAQHFFYSWSELRFSPYDWLSVGIVGQRTHVFQTDRKLDRGFLLGVNHKRVGFTAHVLNPDKHKSLYIFSTTVEF